MNTRTRLATFALAAILAIIVPVLALAQHPWSIYATKWASGTNGPTLLTTSPIVVTAADTLIQLLRCNNITAVAASITVTDNTSSRDLVTAFVLPGNSDVQFINAPSGMLVGGFRWTAGTASAIQCFASGMQ